jgi:hypothetical protein
LQPPSKRTKTQEEEVEEVEEEVEFEVEEVELEVEEDEDEDEPERKLDVTVQTGLYAAEMFAANVAVKHLINLIIVGVLFRLFLSAML